MLLLLVDRLIVSCERLVGEVVEGGEGCIVARLNVPHV